MAEKPYYEQEYQEPERQVPDPTFGQVFKLMFTAPFKWNARSTRKGFWIGYAINVVLSAVLSLISALMYTVVHYMAKDGHDFSDWSYIAIVFCTTIVIIATIVFSVWITLGQLGFTIRRLHDSGHTGWWYWITFVPFGQLVLLYFMVLPTKEEPVRWGGYLFREKNK